MILKIKAAGPSADKVKMAIENAFPGREYERCYNNFYFWFTVEVSEDEWHAFEQGWTYGHTDIGDAEIV